jgi:molecular chaperone GrpE
MNEKNIESNFEFEEKIEALLSKIKLLEDDVKSNWELFLRSKADLENFKKKTDREIVNITKYANKKLLLDLLPLLDSFESCLSKFVNDNNIENIKLFYNLFLNFFEKNDVRKINVEEYSYFDPSKHEVVFTVESNIHDNVISSVLQSGYILHDQILRYAKVSIFTKNS